MLSRPRDICFSDSVHLHRLDCLGLGSGQGGQIADESGLSRRGTDVWGRRR
jgi:hypothetical protein